MALLLSDPRAPPPSPCIGSFDEDAIPYSPMNDVRFNLCPPGNVNSLPSETMNGTSDVTGESQDLLTLPLPQNNSCSTIIPPTPTPPSLSSSSIPTISTSEMAASTATTTKVSGNWTEEDTDNCDNMFLVESGLGETIFIFVKGSIIQEKDCITGVLLRSFDLNKLNCAQFLDDEEPRLKLIFNSTDSDRSGVNEVYYTFENEESLNQFKDQFIAPFINEEYLGIPVGREVRPSSSTSSSASLTTAVDSSRLEEAIGMISSRTTSGFSFHDMTINFFGTQINIPTLSKSKSHFDSNQSTESDKKGARWTEEDVENSEDMYLVENKEGKTVFLFVKDNIIHEKDCVSGDVWVNHDLGVLSNAIFPETGAANNLEMKLSFDSRVQSKKEARYTFEDVKSFDLFRKQFVEPALTQRAKQLAQGRRRFECLKCGFTEIAGQSHEKDNTCPQCSSGFTFFHQ